MFNIVKHRNLYFLISFLLILPGVISLLVWGLKLSIDFTGGTRTTLLFPEVVNEKTVENAKTILEKNNLKIATIRPSEKRLILQTETISDAKSKSVFSELKTKVGDFKEEEVETIGPTIGSETTLNAFKSLTIASVLIVLYIAYSFRAVPKPASSWRFGVCAIVALLHDAVLLIGIFSLLGHFFQIEVDSLFVTALLTVVGFSVHDTIVVFDRIRENLRQNIGAPFEAIVNDSILQTFVRSLNTSLTTILVLFTLLLLGGESIRWFVFALLIGIISGTYSSIFNAAQMLIVWQEFDKKRKLRIRK